MTAGLSGGEDDLPSVETAREFYANYDPKEILGKGISSTVRKCVNKTTGKAYAVKIIDVSGERIAAYEAQELRDATMQEIGVLRQCASHPHIIDLIDVYESSTFIFLVFELCDKGELFDYLTDVVALSEKKTRHIMRQLLDAVAFIHSKSICHRDLKPENILLDSSLQIKVSDFGFAVNMSPDEKLTDLCGTPGYLAPEVLACSMYESAPGYGIECDMWACGVIMYTLMVGFPPFWHRKQLTMLRMIMEGRYQFSSPEWDDISDTAKDLISKLLVVDPKARLTAKQALAHSFFTREERVAQALKFNARQKLKSVIIAVLAMNRYCYMLKHPPPRSLTALRTDPYRSREFRKMIDGCAFLVYAHWVKKGEEQNRAALFENKLRRDLRAATMISELQA